MFERFTDRARRVLVLAQEEARSMDHNFIGTEHILLGLLAEGEGVASRSLRMLGIELSPARDLVIQLIGNQAPANPAVAPAFTPRAKKVLEMGLREGLQLGHNYIGTEHLLLGIVREGEGVAAQIIQSMGVTLDDVRATVLRVLVKEPEDAAKATPMEPPLCPRCRQSLAETARYRQLDVTHADEAGTEMPFNVLFCSACGIALGFVQRPPA